MCEYVNSGWVLEPEHGTVLELEPEHWTEQMWIEKSQEHIPCGSSDTYQVIVMSWHVSYHISSLSREQIFDIFFRFWTQHSRTFRTFRRQNIKFNLLFYSMSTNSGDANRSGGHRACHEALGRGDMCYIPSTGRIGLHVDPISWRFSRLLVTRWPSIPSIRCWTGCLHRSRMCSGTFIYSYIILTYACIWNICTYIYINMCIFKYVGRENFFQSLNAKYKYLSK